MPESDVDYRADQNMSKINDLTAPDVIDKRHMYQRWLYCDEIIYIQKKETKLNL